LGIPLVIALFVGCGVRSEQPAQVPTVDLSGTYTGYSWAGEAQGKTLEEATQKIETVLTLNTAGVITDASLKFLVKNSDGTWRERNDTSATVEVDYGVSPTSAVADPYTPGTSMFKVKTADLMSFFALGVDKDGTVAFALVDPIHRYMEEMKFNPGFDYSMKITQLTIGSGLLVPTIRESSGGYLKIHDWTDYSDKHIFDFYDPYIYVSRGTFQGLGPNSTVKDLLEKAGVRFINNLPEQMEPTYGFYASGGWAGNYANISNYLIGKSATDMTSLIDWSNPRYSANINQDNFFGLDTLSGATRTVQNSTDGISGATVRVSREATSYQRALVSAGILNESEVIKGRF